MPQSYWFSGSTTYQEVIRCGEAKAFPLFFRGSGEELVEKVKVSFFRRLPYKSSLFQNVVLQGASTNGGVFVEGQLDKFAKSG